MARKASAWREVKWKNIEALLLEHYEVGTSKEGADAFPPLLLMKCMLLQKCFRPGGRSAEWVSLRPRGLRTRRHIPSDPELENQTCPVESVSGN